MENRRLPLIFAIVIIGLVMVGISSTFLLGGGDDSEEYSLSSRSDAEITANEQPQNPNAPPAGAEADNQNVEWSPEQNPQQKQQNRLVIKDASVSLQIEDTAAALENITVMAEGMGGWVVNSSSNQYNAWNGDLLTRGSITIRIPSDQFSDVLSQVRELGLKVLSEQISGQDVTAEYTDIQSQVRNLQVAEAQLQEIMDTAVNVSDVLSVHNRLIEVRSQIETLQGRSNYLQQASAFSTIRVELSPVEPERPDEESESRVDRNDKWNPGETVENAFEVLIAGLQIGVDGLIWVAICGLPFAIIAVPSWLGYRAYQRRRKPSPTPSTENPPNN